MAFLNLFGLDETADLVNSHPHYFISIKTFAKSGNQGLYLSVFL
jgi:ABC-type uncharacterized transport system substrate-binding protein